MMPKLKNSTLQNSNGLELEVLNYGATITSLKVPNKYHKQTNVVVSLETPEAYVSKEYLHKNLFLGSTIGRYAGRISQGGFNLSNKRYTLTNTNGIHLHGGVNGFDKKFWDIVQIEKGEEPSITLSCTSRHLEEGYPGNLKVSVTYKLTVNNALKITYRATTDRTTHVNLTNHTYFNLNGAGSILDHELHINSKKYVAVDEWLIPTGGVENIENTRFDFYEKDVINRSDFVGLDTTFILEADRTKASLYAKETGILMKIKTNQPAVVVYTPKNIEGLRFKDKAAYDRYPAICFETQKLPDTPHQESFPTTIVLPNTTYINESQFEFYNV